MKYKNLEKIKEHFKKYNLNNIYIEMIEYYLSKDEQGTLEVLDYISKEMDKGSLLVPKSIQILLVEKMPFVTKDFYSYVKASSIIKEKNGIN